jgi:polyisoprenoid-binding protein YceI
MRTSTVPVALVALCVLPTFVTGALAEQGAATFDAVKAGTYKVDTYHTEVGFSLLHFGFTNYAGLFSGVTGTLKLDPAHLGEAKLDVTISVDSIMTTVPELTDGLKGPQWFDTARFPNGTFVSTKIVPGTGGNATITGNLTLRGVTKPVTLQAHLIGAGANPLTKVYTVGFEATGTIKRSDFGVNAYVPIVGDDVQLTIAGAFEL